MPRHESVPRKQRARDEERDNRAQRLINADRRRKLDKLREAELKQYV